MISLDQARNQRQFLQSLYESSPAGTPAELPVLDVAEELSLDIAEAFATAEQLRDKGLVVLLGAATPQYAHVRITPRGVQAAGERVLRRRAS